MSSQSRSSSQLLCFTGLKVPHTTLWGHSCSVLGFQSLVAAPARSLPPFLKELFWQSGIPPSPTVSVGTPFVCTSQFQYSPSISFLYVSALQISELELHFPHNDVSNDSLVVFLLIITREVASQRMKGSCSDASWGEHDANVQIIPRALLYSWDSAAIVDLHGRWTQGVGSWWPCFCRLVPPGQVLPAQRRPLKTRTSCLNGQCAVAPELFTERGRILLLPIPNPSASQTLG